MATILTQTVGWLIGSIPAIIAIIALIYENRRFRLTMQTQILLSLNNDWCSREMKILRVRVARNLLHGLEPNLELGELLDFFSMLGYLYNAKAVDATLLDNQFGWWFVRYWLCAKEWVEHIRQTADPDGWKNVEVVANRLIAKEQSEGQPLPACRTELQYFLRVEEKLLI